MFTMIGIDISRGMMKLTNKLESIYFAHPHPSECVTREHMVFEGFLYDLFDIGSYTFPFPYVRYNKRCVTS